MSKSSTRASYIFTCLSFSDVHLSNITSLVENVFSPSKVLSLVVVVVVMVVGGLNPRNVFEGDNESALTRN